MVRVLLVVMLFAAACGRQQSVAPKNAAAHDEAPPKDVAVAVGHEHHGSPAAVPPADHSAHGTMDHGAHGVVSTAGADPHAAHRQQTAVDHSQHRPAAPGADPHAGHRQPAAPAQTDHAHHVPGAGTAPGQPAGAPAVHHHDGEADSRQPPTVNRQPITLQPDAFDAPAASSVAEAGKASGNVGAHESHAALYACPMHPEVTSKEPGTCPKCGMALVKK